LRQDEKKLNLMCAYTSSPKHSCLDITTSYWFVSSGLDAVLQIEASGHFRCLFFNSKLNLKLLKVNFLKNNFSESHEAQKLLDKPSPMGLGTVRSGGLCKTSGSLRWHNGETPEKAGTSYCKSRSSGGKITESTGFCNLASGDVAIHIQLQFRLWRKFLKRQQRK
jgi:hypothetical protein